MLRESSVQALAHPRDGARTSSQVALLQLGQTQQLLDQLFETKERRGCSWKNMYRAIVGVDQDLDPPIPVL